MVRPFQSFSIPRRLICEQLRYGISLQVWPSGSVSDSVDALDFTDLQDINCMVEKFPLAKANDAFGKLTDLVIRMSLTLSRCYAKWESEIQGRHNHGLIIET